MSYTYMALSFRDGKPIAVYTRKYELRNWCRWEEKEGYPSGGWLALYRIRNGCARSPYFSIQELEYENGELIDKAP